MYKRTFFFFCAHPSPLFIPLLKERLSQQNIIRPQLQPQSHLPNNLTLIRLQSNQIEQVRRRNTKLIYF